MLLPLHLNLGVGGGPPPFVPGPPACPQVGLDVTPRAAARINLGPLMQSLGAAPQAAARADLDPRARARAETCKPR